MFNPGISGGNEGTKCRGRKPLRLEERAPSRDAPWWMCGGARVNCPGDKLRGFLAKYIESRNLWREATDPLALT